MGYHGLTLCILIFATLMATGCGQEPGRLPPSLTVENKSHGVVWYSYVKINDRLIPFGGVGGTYFKTVGFSLDNVRGVRSSIFGLRISTNGEAGTSPWIERIYETMNPVLPDQLILDKIEDVRFLYSEDRSAKVLLLGKDQSVFGEIQMKLKEEINSGTAGK